MEIDGGTNTFESIVEVDDGTSMFRVRVLRPLLAKGGQKRKKGAAEKQ